MKKQKFLIVGNWKMNPESLEEAKNIVSEVKKGVKNLKKTQVVLCPPFVYLSPLKIVSKDNLFLGAQDAHSENSGSYTGEVSYSQLPEFGVKFVVLGHSERRKMGETDDLINKKVKSVVNDGMTVILCVGENTRDNHGEYFDMVKNQILLALKDVSKKYLERIIIAYEPVWAIGAKDSVTPSDLLEMSIYIRKVLKDFAGPFSEGIQVLYGGSVDRVNADRLVREGNVSGLLIGRESLKPKNFVEIIKLVDAI